MDNPKVIRETTNVRCFWNPPFRVRYSVLSEFKATLNVIIDRVSKPIGTDIRVNFIMS